MLLDLTHLKEYLTLNDVIRRNLIQYNWNLNVLSPKNLAEICYDKGIEYLEQSMGNTATGYYIVKDGLPHVIVNSDLTTTSKWFAAACKIASHFTTEPIRARALGAIALMPTWMLREYSLQELRDMGYCDQFLTVRQQAATNFHCVQPVKTPFVKPIKHISEVLLI